VKTALIYRHLVDGHDTHGELFESYEGFDIAEQVCIDNDYPLEFGMNLTLDADKLPGDLHYLKNGAVNGHTVFNPERRGSGASYRQICFPRLHPESGKLQKSDADILICADLDQFRVWTEEDLERIVDFTDRMRKDNALYGIGSRDVPVILATNERNSQLRMVCEHYHALALGDPCAIRLVGNPTPAYADIGEFVSGFYAVNRNHPHYPALEKRIASVTQDVPFLGFAVESFVAFEAHQVSQIARAYVPSRPNRFYEQLDEQVEFDRVCAIMSRETSELASAGYAKQLVSAVENKAHLQRLGNYYSSDDIRLVASLMREAAVSAVK
jgi:hypothetical protein